MTTGYPRFDTASTPPEEQSLSRVLFTIDIELIFCGEGRLQSSTNGFRFYITTTEVVAPRAVDMEMDRVE